MTLPLDLLAGYAAGVGLGLAAADPLAKTSDPTRTRYFAVTAIFAAGAVAPAACLVYGLYPDWSLMYLASSAQLPILLVLPVVIAACLSAPLLGFLVTHHFLSIHKKQAVHGTLYATAALATLLVALGRNRLGTLGHYEAFHYGGQVVPLYESHAIVVLALVVPAVVAAFVLTRRELRRHLKQLADVAEGVPVRASDRR